ncbi:cytidine deaminase family protein [Flavobacterium sp.]|uniref:cytidine deaminase family protein n=1 Tax=Flavobacterium sp. TaxID=239 RepID=UPI0040478C15
MQNKLEILVKNAWKVRENASILGNTKVGAALISENGNIYVGCNIEQLYRNKDIHAEVSAINNMIVNGESKFTSIVIVAERKKFTPCGTCMDWIFQFGGPETIVAYQNEVDGEIFEFLAKELMPHYPY